jgi:hypothetical protein
MSNSQAINWSVITDGLTDGSITKIEQIAKMIGVSRPTAKKLLTEKYGPNLIFKRGRSGGLVYNPCLTVPQSKPTGVSSNV